MKLNGAIEAEVALKKIVLRPLPSWCCLWLGDACESGVCGRRNPSET